MFQVTFQASKARAHAFGAFVSVSSCHSLLFNECSKALAAFSRAELVLCGIGGSGAWE